VTVELSLLARRMDCFVASLLRDPCPLLISRAGGVPPYTAINHEQRLDVLREVALLVGGAGAEVIAFISESFAAPGLPDQK
jgi:hypothetical protein